MGTKETLVSGSRSRTSFLVMLDISTTKRSRLASQCAGISPSHSTPESLYSGYGRKRLDRSALDPAGHLSHRLRLPSEPESPAATARRRARPA